MTLFRKLQCNALRRVVGLGLAALVAIGNSPTPLAQDRNVSNPLEAFRQQIEEHFTPAVRTLLTAAGIDPKNYLVATRPSHGMEVIAGVRGIFSVGCKLREQGADGLERCTQFEMGFRANIPVTRCVSFDQGDAYLLGHGWHHVDLNPPPGGYDLLPTERVYEDAAGASIALGPWMSNGCLTNATMTTPRKRPRLQ